MVATLQASDWSTYQPAHTQADMRKLKAAGIELIIPGAWHGGSANPKCRDDLKLARAEGLYTGTYAIVTTDGKFSIDRAYEVCGSEWKHLSFCAVDMELAGGSVPQVRAAIDRVIELGQRPIIYTAHWFWHGRFGNPDDFKDIPLWNAYYDQDPDIDFDSLPYGGWTDVVGEQYIGTHIFEGLEMDRNTFVRVFIEPPQEDDEMRLVRERSSGFVFVMSGVWYSYLHRIEDAVAMGVSTDIEVVPDGTLQSYVRADKWWA